MTLTKIRDIVAVVGGGTPRKSTAEYYGGTIPWVTPKDMKRPVIATSEVSLTDEGMKNSPAKLVPAGSVLVVVRSGVLKHTLPVALTTAPVTINQDMKALVPSNAIHAPYMARMVKALQPTVLGWVRATTADNFPIDNLLDLKVNLPPLDEQRRVAAILDRADTARVQLDSVSNCCEELLQAIFADMFADEKAEIRPLSEVVQPGTIITYGIVQAGPEYKDGVPYIRTGDIESGEIKESGLRRTDPAIAQKFERSTVRTGDIVMSIRATVGTTALVPPELDGSNLTQGTARISPSQVTTGPYLLQYLRSEAAQRWIQAQVKGATFREITLGRLRELPVPVPNIRRQELFASRLQVVERCLRQVANEKLQADELFASLQSRAFRGAL